VLLSAPDDIWENSDSECVVLLGGMSMSEKLSPEGDVTCISVDSSASPTKQHRVLISSITTSVKTSSGTRVDRLEAGMFPAALRDVGGGR
jgi:hypothetical protein